MKRFPFHRQLDQMDCGPTCLRMIAEFHGKQLSIEGLRRRCEAGRQGVSLGGVADAAQHHGLKSLGARVDYDMLAREVPLPCIVHWRQRHFVVVFAADARHVNVADPGFGKVRYARDEFVAGWADRTDPRGPTGTVLLLEPLPEFHASEENVATPRRGLGFLLPYLRPYRQQTVQLVLGLFVSSAFLLSMPFLTQALVDQGIALSDPDFVHLILLAQLTLFFSQTLVELLRGWVLLHVGGRLHITLVSDFLIKLMRLPMPFFDAKTLGDILQRVGDHDRVERFLSASTLSMMFSVFNVAVFTVVLAIYDLTILIVFLTGTILYIAWVLAFMRRRAALDYKRFDRASGNQSSLVQLVNGMQEIKLNGSERRRRWEWESIQVSLYRIALKGMALFQYQSAGGNFINELKNILITVLAAKAVMSGDLTLGAMLSIQFIIGQLNAPIAGFLAFVQSWQDARISLDRLAEIHEREGEDRSRGGGLRALPADSTIRLTGGLTFRYPGAGQPNVLENIEVTIPMGRITAIVGASGSGKTTLLKLLLGFYEPDGGAVRVGPHRLDEFDVDFWRRQCGVVMQDGYIFADTIARNVTESDADAEPDPERLGEALRIANLTELIEALPAGVETRIGDSGIALSGGQRQRVLIARAVYKNPPLLLFDEATSALDARNERIIMQNLAAFYRHRTVVVIAHRLSTVRDADQILMLENGRLVERGRHEELTRQRGAYFALVSNQLELGA